MQRSGNVIDGLAADLAGLELIRDEAVLRQRSRDFYWYSPVLKRQLEDVCADLVVEPRAVPVEVPAALAPDALVPDELEPGQIRGQTIYVVRAIATLDHRHPPRR